MKKISYEVLRVGIGDTNEAPIGKDIFYQCNICQSIIPSSPRDNIHCSCANIGIDKDMHRLNVQDYSKITILKKKT
jgi:hypothetical protein